ncbi:NAD-dependent epimerase [Cyclobacterium amurskyense]|uniref:dTDP-glucose 4,6-dehydratase n=1 Tax=Cyclobacterium amurskyense TaxID=320787 RepID=A0A0H4P6J4_9BACT|nr:NAD-dependent epimerase [Cyclobacterium amurskyense]AKP50056.1 dTDP-glucose 4,6-dehydratase [Cyclobacterium amurskyense]|tara:strand:+ start:42212 stop:43264 length:1053 start_codon:yes stop_codon:yes gene_type:complete
MKILVTGTAGFIGMHLAKKLLDRGDEVVGLDSINDYYDVNLKKDRLRVTGIEPNNIKYGQPIKSINYPNYTFLQLNLEDKESILNLFKDQKFDKVVNLAAQAGVRYSLTNPDVYIQSNIVGFGNILEACRYNDIQHLTYASSSSIYGMNTEMPFSTSQNVDHPVSVYAASKKSNELMAHTYSHLFDLPTTGLRFFTVYGPWGRPDMALFLFTKAILEGNPIQVFNYGEMHRDFTFVGDIVEGVLNVLDNPAIPNPNWTLETGDVSKSKAPYAIYNIGNSNPIRLMDFIKVIEDCLGLEAKLELLPLQPGDVPATFADTSPLEQELGYKPDTPLSYGVGQFVDWYRNYYNV